MYFIQVGCGNITQETPPEHEMLENHDQAWKCLQTSLVHEHTEAALKNLVTTVSPIKEAIKNLFQSETNDLRSGNMSLGMEEKVPAKDMFQWLTKQMSNTGIAIKVQIYSFIRYICSSTQQKQNFCITYVQRRPNVSDVGPALYKFYTNVLCLLGNE